MVAPLLIDSSSGWAWISSMRRSGLTRQSCYAPHPAPCRHGKRYVRPGVENACMASHAPALQDFEGLGVVAAVGVADAPVLQHRLLVDAQLPLALGEHVGELLAAGAELAARRRVGRARHVAADDDPLALPLAARVGQRD